MVSPPIILIVIVAVLGYGSGLGAEILLEGEMSKACIKKRGQGRSKILLV